MTTTLGRQGLRRAAPRLTLQLLIVVSAGLPWVWRGPASHDPTAQNTDLHGISVMHARRVRLTAFSNVAPRLAGLCSIKPKIVRASKAQNTVKWLYVDVNDELCAVILPVCSTNMVYFVKEERGTYLHLHTINEITS